MAQYVFICYTLKFCLHLFWILDLSDIFISYRRQDAGADAGRLYDRLSAYFGGDHVFMDVDDIELGQNFVHVLEDTLEHCDVLLVLIGRRWLTAVDEQGRQRLENPTYFVRQEIQRAAQRDINIIPITIATPRMV